jgi:exonuclease SbcC
MSILTRLFKSSAKPLSLQERIAALDTLPSSALLAITQSDDEQALRLAAVAHLPYGPELRQLAFAGHAEIERQARQQLAQALDDGTLTLETLRRAYANERQLLAIVGFCSHANLSEQILTGSDNMHFLLDIALQAPAARLRQLAAQRIDDADTLQQLLKASKGKDKGVYRIVKDKCDRLRDAQRQQEQQQAELASLCERIELHSLRTYDPQFVVISQRLQEKWQSQHELADEQLQQRAAVALAACQAVLDKRDAGELALQEAQQAVTVADSERAAVLATLKQHLLALYAAEEALEPLEETLRQSLLEQQDIWQKAQQAKLDRSAEKSYVALTQAIERQQHLARRQGNLATLLGAIAASPEDDTHWSSLSERLADSRLLAKDGLPTIVQEAKTVLNDQQQAITKSRTDEQQRERKIGGLLKQAQGAIESGHYRRAFGIDRTLNELVAANNAAELPEFLQRRLEEHNAAIAKLQDWQDYATLPKKQELVVAMTTLAEKVPQDSVENIDHLATQIKDLQQQWKSVSRGDGPQHETLWQEFKLAADLAYAPCKLQSQQQRTLRKQNLRLRKTMVKQLHSYFANHDWQAVNDNDDWKKVEQLLRVARQEWHSYSPVNRGENTAVEKTFNLAIEPIQQLLNGEYERNRDAKEALVTQAQQLLADNTDSRRAVDTAKALQSQWQHVGLMSRKVDQQLWKQFRQAIDEVFEQRQQQSADFKNELKQHQIDAEALCEQLETLLQQGDASSEAVRQLQDSFAAIGALPKQHAQSVQARFQKAVAGFDALRKQQREAAKLQQWQQVMEANHAINDYALALLHNSEPEAAQATAEAALNAVKRWPVALESLLRKKLAEADKASKIEANALALRELCIRREILCGKDSPASDSQMRMQYKVDRLSRGLGQAADDELGLHLLWLGAGAVEGDEYEALWQRFSAA